MSGVENRARHTRGCRLTMRTGDTYPVLQPHELSEHLGASDDRKFAFFGFTNLRVRAGDSGGVHNEGS